MNIDSVEAKLSLGIEDEAELQVETEAAEPKLAELLRFARELMLKKPADEAGLGSNGTDKKGAFDTATHVEVERLANLGGNRESIDAIERFGRDILDEAFECFGEDGPIALDKFRKAETTDEKIDVCRHIEGIVNVMAEKAVHQFDDEDKETHRYSPIRLSPKLIGIYPDTVLETTCLGKSILMASFFAKLGLPMLHGGVVLSSQDDKLTVQAETIKQILAPENHPGHTISPVIYDILDGTSLSSAIATMVPRGFHAATYAEIEEGVWIQHDPNYGSAVIRNEGANRLDEAFGDLMVLHEDTYSTAEARLMLAANDNDYFFADLAKAMGTVLPAYEMVDDILRSTPSHEVYGVIVEKLFLSILPLGPEGAEDETRLKIKETIGRCLILTGRHIEPYAEEAIGHVLDTYVFVDSNNSRLESIERCKTDKAYRERMVADLCIAPLMLVLKVQSDWFEAKKKALGPGGYGHTCVDLGLPEYRIGICVLSDIAGHYGDELPLSAWLAYWPSDVSLAEHFRQTPTPAQKLLARFSIARTLRRKELTYPAIYEAAESL